MVEYAQGQFQVDYEARVDFERLRRARVSRTQEAMRASGLDALVLWKDENVRYLTSLRAITLQYRSTTQYGVMLFPEGGPVLFLSGGEYARAKDAMPWIAEFVVIPIMEEVGMVEAVTAEHTARLLREHGADGGRVGFDGMTVPQLDAYTKHLHRVERADGETFMQGVRRIKLPDEIQLLREAAAIADAVTQTAIESVRAGVRECEVAGEAMRTLFRLGGEFAHLASPFVASGERMSPPTRFATDKLIRDGDLVFIDIGACWNGYFGDVGRAVICGAPSDIQRKVYRSVHECLRVAHRALRPGRTNHEVAEEIKEAAARAGLEKHFIHLFIGHGLGITPNEPPYIGEPQRGAGEVVLAPGMVFAVEPLIWLPGVRGGGGVRLEDTLLVTEAEPEVLTRCGFDPRLL
ncbi:MAG TPA: Xaa-Pro peptidase family protein [Candidatus Methylomirabilis sp.]|nr:Xaa-Pro peptidase family protein [Candidatus Methylomirabilis sp.]